MLGLEFEEFELISSQDELWILKSNEIIFDDETIAEIRKKSDEYFDVAMDDANNQEGYHVLDCQNRCYGDMLLNYINKFDNIELIRRYLDG